MSDNEMAMSIIADSGNSKSYSLEALASIKEKQFELADELLKKSDEALLAAHKTHTELLVKEAQGDKITFSMFLMHSESHLNMAEITREYVDALYHMAKEMGGKKHD